MKHNGVYHTVIMALAESSEFRGRAVRMNEYVIRRERRYYSGGINVSDRQTSTEKMIESTGNCQTQNVHFKSVGSSSTKLVVYSSIKPFYESRPFG